MKRTLIAVLFCAAASPAAAQHRSPPLAPDSHAAQLLPRQQSTGIRPLAIGKWAFLASGIGAATYGFVEGAKADDLYEDLEERCIADAALCRSRTPDGGYTDPELETLYQDVLSRDTRTRTALIAGQLSLASSLVLFLLDMGSGPQREGIPYEPPRLRVTPEGLEVRLR